MPKAYHVNGPALVKTGTGSGSPAALEELGFSENGVDLAIRFFKRPMMTDVAGSLAPAEFQDMGKDADIRVNLVPYDTAVLQALLAKGGQATEGLNNSPGRLVGTSGDAFKLVISSPNAALPWRFHYCTLRDAQEVKLGTVNTVWRLHFYAWVFVPATANTARDLPLYDHTDAA